MRNGSNTPQKEYDFKSVEMAKKMLNDWGYSLNDKFFPGTLYHVHPMGREEDYPKIKLDGKTPRHIATVDSKGKLFVRKPSDDNSILIRHQKELEMLVSQLSSD